MLRWQRHLAAFAVVLVYFAFVQQEVSFAQDRLTQDHVVPLKAIQKQLESRSEARTTNLADIERVLSLPAAQDMLRKSKLGMEQVKPAIAMLSEDELSRLATQARLVEKDVEGGILIGILALIGLVVVILIVVAVVNDNK
ncbi:MAG: hypothetical protein HY820_36945 [Acidobacteria bacterium]|nr:hypothetical protein [Acidobacteriota bacterium]